MPTTEDLTDVLRAHAEQAAEAADDLRERLTTAPPQQDNTRRKPRRAAPLLAAAAVVAVAVAGGVVADVLQPSGGGQGSAGGGSVALPSGAPQWNFQIDTVPGFTITRALAAWSMNLHDPAQGAWSDTATITTARGARKVGSIGTVPQWDLVVQRPARAQSVTVPEQSGAGPGQSGFFVPGRHVSQYGLSSKLYRHPWVAAQQNDVFQPELAWQNTDGSWSLIVGTFGFDPKTYDYNNAAALMQMEQLASGVRPAATNDPVTMPFATAPLPNGYIATDISNIDGKQCIDYTTPTMAVKDLPIPDVALAVCRAAANAAQQDITEDSNYASTATRTLNDGTVFYAGVPHGVDNPLPESVLQQLVDTADVTPQVGQPGTWQPVQG